MPSILMILTSARTWSLRDGGQRPTGFWGEEFVVPHRLLTEAGVNVTIATPGGLVPVADEFSLVPETNGGDVEKVADLRAYLERVAHLLEKPARLEDIDPADFDGVLIPGGHGPMQDLAVNPDVARVLATLLPDESKVVAALCHGQASFFSAGNPDGNWLFKGRKLTAFTDEEETQTGLAANALWLLEERLRGGGAEFTSGPAWGSYVVVDGNLVTGQNPASGEAAAKAILKELADRA
ncbi:type 1 glutamine amidotransferase domain-containing protein [Micromonospora sp. NBC_01796]|uniref:type 1 glutamine amidotransferase domain-containing protein n=1 Tax=Micromonospora sp. NBC_01796 TaxID=2975987 RepID=UPI002DD8DDA9|nr:type 1 glutamine amidotransferase domain-containing protein [Micromonospora sp. NBC_01796]WSA88985.1 type 1 glutamine amidotransferase domain-containing protein [Micromonospora sp. NBC_01796]